MTALLLTQRSKGHRYRFSLLTQELRGSETDEYSACILAFINCILAGAADLSRRVKLRNEFIGKDILLSITWSCFDHIPVIDVTFSFGVARPSVQMEVYYQRSTGYSDRCI